MAKYNEEFKTTTVRKALLPDGPGPASVAEEASISLQTLYNWLRKLRGDAYGFSRSEKWIDSGKAGVVAGVRICSIRRARRMAQEARNSRRTPEAMADRDPRNVEIALIGSEEGSERGTQEG